MKELEKIKSQIEWAKENIPYASPLDNLGIEDIEWMIKKIEEQQLDIKYLSDNVNRLSEESGKRFTKLLQIKDIMDGYTP